jgi:hypothetical protein
MLPLIVKSDQSQILQRKRGSAAHPCLRASVDRPMPESLRHGGRRSQARMDWLLQFDHDANL